MAGLFVYHNGSADFAYNGSNVVWSAAGATGQRYALEHQSKIWTGTFGNQSYFPGSTAGYLEYGSYYDAYTPGIGVDDDAYNASSWNGNTDVPTKNAIRDKIESLSTGNSDIANHSLCGGI